MSMKPRFATLLLFALALFSCGKKKEGNPNASLPAQGVTFYLASDTHYLPPSLHDDGSYFQSLSEKGDGKWMKWNEEIVSSLCEETASAKPDYLILTGDLSLNGEKKGWEALHEKLEAVEKEGVKVCLIPGNHDFGEQNSPVRYVGEKAYSEEAMDRATFRETFFDMGPDLASSKDSSSCSYVVPVSRNLSFLFLDANGENLNEVGEKTLRWLEKELEKMQKNGVRAICFSHQNLLLHNEIFDTGYRIPQSEEILSLFSNYGVRLSFSGHLHIQHVKTEDGFTELTSSSLLVNPYQYGVVQCDASALQANYGSVSVDLNSYAKRHSLTDEDLLEFPDSGAHFFRSLYAKQAENALPLFQMSSEDAEAAITAWMELNQAYFAGEAIDPSPYQNGVEIFQKAAGGMLGAYLKSVYDSLSEGKNSQEGSFSLY